MMNSSGAKRCLNLAPEEWLRSSRALLIRRRQLLEERPFLADDRFVDDELLLLLHIRQVEHHIRHYFLDDAAQPAGAGVAFLGKVGDCLEATLAEFQLGAFHLE